MKCQGPSFLKKEEKFKLSSTGHKVVKSNKKSEVFLH